MASLKESIIAARRCSTPLIVVKSPDQAVTIETLKAAVANGAPVPVFVWECVRGLTWANDAALEIAWKVLANKSMAPLPTRADDIEKFRTELGNQTVNLTNTLIAAHKLPDKSLLVIQNMQWAWDKTVNIQAAWNLRDAFKANFRTLVMLTGMGATIPDGLRDALPLAEELPTLEELGKIVDEQFEAVGIPAEPKVRTAAIDAVCGLPAFNAEQSIAISFRKRDGKVILDTDAVWNRKRTIVSQTNGLSIWRGDENFSQLGGLKTIKDFMLAVLHGEDPPRAIVFIDEIEKAFAGATDGGQDTSGTTQEMLGTLLTEMQNREYTGVIIVGPPGTGKSAFSKALAGEAHAPCIVADISAGKSKYVGESNANVAQMLNVIYSVSQGKALFIATCNSVAKLPPELKRRFTLGVFYMDMPDNEEKPAIWKVYLKQYKLENQKLPADAGWTGADIKQCCNLAYRLRKPLIEVAQFLTPVAQTDSARIEQLRIDSSGKYLSASYPGKYEYNRTAPAPATTGKGKRAIRVE